MRIVSIGTQIKQISGLVDTDDLNEWENKFVIDMDKITHNGSVVGTLSDKQINLIERIYKKHFA